MSHLSEPEFSKNQRIARINRKTGLRYLITNVGFGGARKYALIVQRSLIKEYEPRRKIYGVFGIIDSVRVEVKVENSCPMQKRAKDNFVKKLGYIKNNH